MVGFGQSRASSAVSALPGAMTSAVAAGMGPAGGVAAAGAGEATAFAAGAGADPGKGSNELATAIATRLR